MNAKRALSLIACCLALSPPGQAQTNSVVTFTNRFATFTNLQGQTYNRVELVRADDRRIIYRCEGGGGTVYYTNLSPATLESLGLSTNRIALAAEQARQEAFQKDQLEAQQRERMKDPANWRTVHLSALKHTVPGPAGWTWSVVEIPGMVVIYNVPSKTWRYFTRYDALVASAAQLNRQLAPYDQRLKQVEAVVKQLKNELYRQQYAENQAMSATYGDPALIEWVMAYTAPIRDWGADINRRGVQAEDLLFELQAQRENLAARLEDTLRQLEDLVINEKKDATEIKVFVTNKKGYGSPILISTGDGGITP